MIMLNIHKKWDETNPTYFKQFIYYILGKMNFNNREWFGRGGYDGGQDIIAYTAEEFSKFICKELKLYLRIEK